MYPPDAVVLCLHSLPAPSPLACHHGELPVSKQNLQTWRLIKGSRVSLDRSQKLALWLVFGFGD